MIDRQSRKAKIEAAGRPVWPARDHAHALTVARHRMSSRCDGQISTTHVGQVDSSRSSKRLAEAPDLDRIALTARNPCPDGLCRQMHAPSPSKCTARRVVSSGDIHIDARPNAHPHHRDAQRFESLREPDIHIAPCFVHPIARAHRRDAQQCESARVSVIHIETPALVRSATHRRARNARRSDPIRAAEKRPGHGRHAA